MLFSVIFLFFFYFLLQNRKIDAPHAASINVSLKYEILCNMQLKFLKIDFKNKIEYLILTQIIELSAATNIMIQRHTWSFDNWFTWFASQKLAIQNCAEGGLELTIFADYWDFWIESNSNDWFQIRYLVLLQPKK